MDDACLLHLRKLRLGDGKLLNVQPAGLGEQRWTCCLHEVLNSVLGVDLGEPHPHELRVLIQQGGTGPDWREGRWRVKTAWS